MTVPNSSGRVFTVTVGEPKRWYGGKPVVRFYDATYAGDRRFDHADPSLGYIGQFVSDYNLETLVVDHRIGTGLNLYGGVGEWQIDGETFECIRTWLALIWTRGVL